MKKIVLATLVATGLMAAESSVYIGLDYGKASNTSTGDYSSGGSLDIDNDYSDLKFKVGYGADGEVKLQMTVSSVTFDKAVFDNTNKQLIEVGFDAIKEFEATKELYPFVKIGFGIGSMTVEGYNQSSIAEVSFNIGAGVSYKVVDHLYLLAGVDYIGRKWQDIEYPTYTVSATDSGFKPYLGMNYRF